MAIIEGGFILYFLLNVIVTIFCLWVGIVVEQDRVHPLHLLMMILILMTVGVPAFIYICIKRGQR